MPERLLGWLGCVLGLFPRLAFSCRPLRMTTLSLAFAGGCVGCNGGELVAEGAGSVLLRGRVAVRIVGRGTVAFSSGVTCSSDCDVETSEPVSLEASGASPAWRFRGFTGACTGLAPCEVFSGTVTARFSETTSLSLSVVGGGTVSVGSAPPCRDSCEIPIDSDTPVSIRALPDPGFALAEVEGICTSLPCETASGGVLRVRFSRLRSVSIDLVGRGRGGVSLSSTDGGVECRTFPCVFGVQPEVAPVFVAVSELGSTLVEWSPCGRSRRCQIDAGTEPVEATVRFEPTREKLKSVEVFGADFQTTQQLGLEILPSEEYVVAISSSSGIGLDGVALGPPGGLTGSFSLMRLRGDGGVVWQHTEATGLRDAGSVQLWVQHLEQSGSDLIGSGSCGGSCPGLPGSQAFTPMLVEIDGVSGALRRLVPFSNPALSIGAVSHWPWFGRRRVFSTGTQFVDARGSVASASITAHPYHVMGSCELVGERWTCSAWWNQAWLDGACAVPRPVGQRAVGLVTLESQSFRCISVETFDSTTPGTGNAYPVGLSETDGGLVFVSAFSHSFSLGPGLTTPAGASVAFVRLGSQPRMLSTAGAGGLDLLRRTERHLAYVVRPGPQFVRTFFGTPVPPQAAALIRVDAEALTLTDVTVFENVWDIRIAEKGPDLALFLRGVDARMDGIAFSPDAGHAAHLIRVREEPR